MDKEERIKKKAEETKLLAMTKSKLIKVVHEEAEKAIIDPKMKVPKELRKKRLDQYMWTTSSRLKREPIAYVKIHPNSKPTVLTVYRANDRRNFQVHNPFKKRYERLRKIPEELGIQSALPPPALEQASSQLLGRKRTRMELEPRIRIPTLECNMSLPKGVPFVNNMVIEEPEHGIFLLMSLEMSASKDEVTLIKWELKH
ncbi:hypothetical protein Tco_0889201 [Tanacetum coccineum]